jgi:hypothetical protein
MSDIKLRINIGIGRLWHYGHFIHDFIMPVIAYLSANPSVKHIYFARHIRDVTLPNLYPLRKQVRRWRDELGDFKPMAEKILGVKITPIASHEHNDKPLVKLNACSFGPYAPDSMNTILPHIRNTMTLPPSPYKVVLIERGVHKLLGTDTDTGAARRSLQNHEEIKNCLSNKYGALFTNVKLETMSIEEQVSLFMNASIVIGQHGAGLCNIMWMKPSAGLVIEFPPYLAPTFMNMCAAKQIRYERCKPDTTAILSILGSAEHVS